MPPQPKRVLSMATTWIREYAQTYLPSEAGFSFSPDDLRAASVSLVTIRHVLRHGHVVHVSKLDEPGAIWIIEGQDNDGNGYRMTVKVVSEMLDVTLRKVERLKKVEKENLDVKKDDGHDAA